MENKKSPVRKDFIVQLESEQVVTDEHIAQDIVEFLATYPAIKSKVVNKLLGLDKAQPHNQSK